MSELKPCPFCGATAVEVNTYHGGGYAAWVTCRSCRVSGAVRDTVSDATKAWNHRPLEDRLDGLKSAAREIRDIEREGGGSMDRVDEYRERWEAAISALCEALEEVEEC